MLGKFQNIVEFNLVSLGSTDRNLLESVRLVHYTVTFCDNSRNLEHLSPCKIHSPCSSVTFTLIYGRSRLNRNHLRWHIFFTLHLHFYMLITHTHTNILIYWTLHLILYLFTNSISLCAYIHTYFSMHTHIHTASS